VSASLAAFPHILVFNCYYLYLFYVVLENKIMMMMMMIHRNTVLIHT